MTPKINADVALTTCPSFKKLYDKLSLAIEACGGLKLDSYEKIVIKINLCDARSPDTGAITDPRFLEVVLRYLRENVGEDVDIYVVESDSRMVLADLYIKWFGFIPVLRKWNAKWCNLSNCVKEKKHVNGKILKEIDFPKIFDDAFFITLPKLKTNILTKITCCLKNQFGCLPCIHKARFHPYIDDVIVDANLIFKPNFCIVDGIISMVSCKGPAFGIPIRSNLLIVGQNPLAVDIICAQILGFNPFSIGHIREAFNRGMFLTRKIKIYILDTTLTSLPKINARWSRLEELILKLASKFQRGSQ